jgi:HSP20 family protein
MAVPGVRVEDLDISIEGRQLSVPGMLPEREGQGRRYWLQDIPQGQFCRTITLPATVDVDNFEARVHDGLLVLTKPKVAQARARKIAINQ